MALKTFNVDAKTYEKYSKHCRKKGISMSKQVENFLMKEIEKIDLKKGGDEEVKAIENKIIAGEAGKEIAVGKKEHPLMKYC